MYMHVGKSEIVSTVYEAGLKCSYEGIRSDIDDFFSPMRSMHCNTDERSMCTARGTMLKNETFWSYSVRISRSAHELIS